MDVPFEDTVRVVIPELTGTYYVVAQVDYDGLLAEGNFEDNNVAFYNQQIQIVPPGCTCASGGGRAAAWPLVGLVLAMATRRRT